MSIVFTELVFVGAMIKIALSAGFTRLGVFLHFVPVLCKHAGNSDFHSALTSFRSRVNGA